MAFRHVLRKRAALPLGAAAFAIGTLLVPKTTLHAEALSQSIMSRKPIYDDPSPPPKPAYNPMNPDTHTIASPRSPTARLATQVRQARVFVFKHTQAAEERLNAFMTQAFDLESSFTSTIASLAPAASTNERIMPGALYILVAGMAGAIVSRNRNILLRGSVPVAVAVAAGWVVLPYTMRNVGDLVWRFEEKVPVVALNHLRLRRAAEEGLRETKATGRRASVWTEELVKEGREMVEGWVRKTGR